MLLFSSNKKGVFYFGHAETVVPVLTALGLFDDHFQLRAADFNAKSTRHRKFCVSRIAPFSVNVALVLYESREDSYHGRLNDDSRKCLTGGGDRSNQFVLELLFNESPMEFPFADRLLWPYSEVRRKYAKYVDGCQFDEICKLRVNEVNSSSTASSRQL